MFSDPAVTQTLDSRLANGELTAVAYQELAQILAGSEATPERKELDLRLARGEIGIPQYHSLVEQLFGAAPAPAPARPASRLASRPDDLTMPPPRPASQPAASRPKTSGRRPGDAIARKYILVRRLGEGGMGEVWAARDTESEVERALKFLPPQVSTSDIEMRRIKENFRLVHALIHEGIAAMIGLEQHESAYVLVLEMVKGKDLRTHAREFLAAYGPGLWKDEVVRLGLQIARALDFAHAKNVIHRDIKPENVLVMLDGYVKVLDFGLAAEIQGSLSRVTGASYDTAGTRPYMAPEQWQGKEQSGATDQYALAVVLYEMLSGALPFDDPNPAALRDRVLLEQPAPLPMLNGGQNAALLNGLSKNREDRFPTCVDLVEAVSAAQPLADELVVESLAAPAQVPLPSTVPSVRAVRLTDLLPQATPAAPSGRPTSARPKTTPAAPVTPQVVPAPIQLTTPPEPPAAPPPLPPHRHLPESKYQGQPPPAVLQPSRGGIHAAPAPVAPVLDPQSLVNGPGLALIIVGAIGTAGALCMLLQALIDLLGYRKASGADSAFVMSLFMVVTNPVVLYAGMKMRQLRSYNVAFIGAVLAVIPFFSTPCFCLGIPVGIWALSVLSKPGVKSAFR
ncbi:MAG: protein kinase [Planctomycetota bacterium]|nr:protein kinase [Planctomycetota bacterium]